MDDRKEPDASAAAGYRESTQRPLGTFPSFVVSSSEVAACGHLDDIYLKLPAVELPNVLCFVDAGAVARVEVAPGDTGITMGSTNLEHDEPKAAAVGNL